MKDSIKYVKDRIDISFFPEGGSLVDNINSTIAFKVVNAIGKSCDVTGELLASTGDLITSFKSTHYGMGIFNLKPVPGLTYYTIIKSNNGTELRADIPRSFSTGVTIRTLLVADNKLLLTVNTNNETLPSIIGSEMIVSLSSRNLITRTTNIKIISLVNNYLIPLGDFPDGIMKVTLTGIEGIPLCERLIYQQRRNDIIIQVSTNKQLYKQREPVRIEVSLSGDTISGEKAFLSLSAVEDKMIIDSALFSSSISSWFLLESDVHGPVENPSYYFDPANKNRFDDLDILLLTQGWRDFKWKYNPSDSFKNENGFSISGRVRKLFKNKPLDFAKVNIGIFKDSSSYFILAEPDSSGHFKVEGIDITGKAKAIASITGKKSESEGWLILDSIPYEPPYTETTTIQAQIQNQTQTQTLTTGSFSELKQEAIIKREIKRRYKLSDTIGLAEVIVTAKKPDSPQTQKINISRSKYGMPDRELIITRDLEEKELVRLASTIFGVWYTGSGLKLHNSRIPIIMLDGMEVSSLQNDALLFINGIPANMIDRIDVVDNPIHDPIINFITKTELSAPNKQQLHSATMVISGYDSPRLFYSPKYNKPESSAFIPDTRSTIYWLPNIVAGGKNSNTISYFNADIATTIVIDVEGMTSNGIPVTGKARYNVN